MIASLRTRLKTQDLAAFRQGDDNVLHILLGEDGGKAIESLIAADPILANQLVEQRDASGRTPLYMAVARRSASLVASLLQVASASAVNAVDGHGRSPLFIALEEGKAADVSALLLANAQVDVNLADAFGTSPLHLVVKSLDETSLAV
jgi:ankyrin repeat protein